MQRRPRRDAVARRDELPLGRVPLGALELSVSMYEPENESLGSLPPLSEYNILSTSCVFFTQNNLSNVSLICRYSIDSQPNQELAEVRSALTILDLRLAST